VGSNGIITLMTQLSVVHICKIEWKRTTEQRFKTILKRAVR